ncbi:hypothetical protein GPA10_05780 [Streptomyces sp. p1417]|uniref:Secreted protein n=1 Tax=Streptomyces typhae TaxID=2681492 RepID=A0A6L6WVC7_9ACTN|nr:hypothetical protein [Streptomyces typhae]MVO84296.1 hypothetical protein [Streptomyces typhae]
MRNLRDTRNRRKQTAAVAVAGALFALAGCGQSTDDVFSNLNGNGSSGSPEATAPASDARPETPPDAPPNYADNSRVRRPGEMSARDEKRAKHEATEVERALEELRRDGRIGPAAVRPLLTRLSAPAHVAVEELRIGTGTGAGKAEGSAFGIWIGGTACVTGSVNRTRAQAHANGHYPETGCLPPAPTH